jgi:hypothetical protein
MSEETSEVALTVRVPKETLDRMDMLVKARPTKIPRHSWLLEAIYEKLFKEDHVEGVLDILCENLPQVGAASYRLLFLKLQGTGGPLAPMTVVGDDTLEGYLREWGFTQDNAKGWINKLRADKSVSIPNVMMPAERVGPYGFKMSSMGIHKRLRDGSRAILYPDHWRNAVDEEIKGHKIVIFASTGYPEREVTITRSGKVLITVEAHILPVVGASSVTFREASPSETEQFLDIYKQFTNP